MGKVSGSILKALITSVSRSKMSVVGAVLVSVLLPVLLFSFFLDLQGVIENPYFGFLIYLVMGPLLLIGIILMIFGIFFSKGKEDIGLYAYEYLQEQLTRPGRFSRVRKLLYLAVIIAFVTLFISGLVTYTGFHYTETTSFCGQFCHDVMEPEYVTYKNSPHSRVSCVECHIGEGAEWFTKAKVSGVRQLVATAMDSYKRPIITPIAALRPVRETCEQCHRPEMFHGDKLYIKDKYLADENNTHVQTALLMKIGSGGHSGRKAQGIHWHVSEEYKVSYVHIDENREQLSQVILTGPDGGKTVYYSNKIDPRLSNGTGTLREMDCIDCHNRPTHIFLSPEEALDQKIVTNSIPESLPYIKRQALEVIEKSYASAEVAKQSIARELRAWYKDNYPAIVEKQGQLLERAISGVQQAYGENVFPLMDITWNTYKNFIGHKDGTGCFRCHDGSHETKDGEVITNKCESCHVALAVEQPSPDILRILKGSSL